MRLGAGVGAGLNVDVAGLKGVGAGLNAVVRGGLKALAFGGGLKVFVVGSELKAFAGELKALAALKVVAD